MSGDPANPVLPATLARPDLLALSLRYLTSYFEKPQSLDGLLAGLPLIDGRLPVDLVPRAARRGGMRAVHFIGPLARLSALALPAILLLRNGGAAVLLSLKDNRAAIYVPEIDAERQIAIADIEPQFSGEAFSVSLEIESGSHHGVAGDERPARWFWDTIAQLWPTYSHVAVAAVMINLLALANSLFSMNVYDRVVPYQAFETLWVLASGMAIVLLSELLLRSLRGWLVDRAGREADDVLASRIFEQVLTIRMEARPASTGAFANNLREFETLRDFFSSATLTTLVDLPFLLFFLLLVWWIGGWIVVVPMFALPIVLGVALAMQWPLDRLTRETMKEAAQKHALLVEAITALETIKAIGAEGRMQRRWERMVEAAGRSALVTKALAGFALNFTQAMQGIVTVGVIIHGVYLISAGQLSVGGLIACSMLAGRALAPLGSFAAILTRLHQTRTALATLDQVMKMPVERMPGRSYLHRPEIEGRIELKGVEFSYPNEQHKALAGVNLAINPGERIALLGRIGSGKSTLGKLLMGLYAPTAGAILIDGVDLAQIDPYDLRRHIGSVPQEPLLFQGSLRDNIAMAAPGADGMAILKAAQASGVDDFARAHPQGYDMAVGERGERLSGGQRQSVTVARALLTDPTILIMDEPTAAMDQASEEQLKARLAPLLEKKTLILFTHRASLLSLVDRVVVLDAGRVVADGPRETILQALAGGKIKTAEAKTTVTVKAGKP